MVTIATGLERIRENLEKERATLLDALSANIIQKTDERRDDYPFGKKEDTISAYSEFERKHAQIRIYKEKLAQVESALGKIQNGTYGQCEKCGRLIPPERLEVLPYTSFCLPCINTK